MRSRSELIAPTAKFTGFLLLVFCLSLKSLAADTISDDTSELELTNFAFANYLGSGFYTSGRGNVFILRVPLSSELGEATQEKSGWVVNYPVALGIGQVDDSDFPDLGDFLDLDKFVTLNITPGLEYIYHASDIWRLAPFVDLGVARDFNNDTTALVRGAGVKSYVTLPFDESSLTIANRLLYADQENLDTDNRTSFASFETALEYTMPIDFTNDSAPVNFSVYFINYHYLDDLVLLDSQENRISLQDKNEIGVTISLPKHRWLPDNSRLGVGVQVTEDADLYRLVFGSPFF